MSISYYREDEYFFQSCKIYLQVGVKSLGEHALLQNQAFSERFAQVLWDLGDFLDDEKEGRDCYDDGDDVDDEGEFINGDYSFDLNQLEMDRHCQLGAHYHQYQLCYFDTFVWLDFTAKCQKITRG